MVRTGKGDDHVLGLRVDIDGGMPRRILAHGHLRNIDAILHQQIQHPTAFRANRADVTCPRPGPGGCDGLVPPLPAQSHAVLKGCQGFAGLRAGAARDRHGRY
jgi:hypothetical protein